VLRCQLHPGDAAKAHRRANELTAAVYVVAPGEPWRRTRLLRTTSHAPHQLGRILEQRGVDVAGVRRCVKGLVPAPSPPALRQGVARAGARPSRATRDPSRDGAANQPDDRNRRRDPASGRARARGRRTPTVINRQQLGLANAGSLSAAKDELRKDVPNCGRARCRPLCRTRSARPTGRS
jgi:hypothetical protein